MAYSRVVVCRTLVDFVVFFIVQPQEVLEIYH